jgi:hypothetical protein
MKRQNREKTLLQPLWGMWQSPPFFANNLQLSHICKRRIE